MVELFFFLWLWKSLLWSVMCSHLVFQGVVRRVPYTQMLFIIQLLLGAGIENKHQPQTKAWEIFILAGKRQNVHFKIPCLCILAWDKWRKKSLPMLEFLPFKEKFEVNCYRKNQSIWGEAHLPLLEKGQHWWWCNWLAQEKKIPVLYVLCVKGRQIMTQTGGVAGFCCCIFTRDKSHTAIFTTLAKIFHLQHTWFALTLPNMTCYHLSWKC